MTSLLYVRIHTYIRYQSISSPFCMYMYHIYVCTYIHRVYIIHTHRCSHIHVLSLKSGGFVQKFRQSIEHLLSKALVLGVIGFLVDEEVGRGS